MRSMLHPLGRVWCGGRQSRGTGLLVTAVLCAAVATAQDVKPADGRSLFTSEALNLRFAYPAVLQQADAGEALHDGHLTMPGLLPARGGAKGDVASCLRPVLLARTAQPAQDSTATEKPSADGSETVVTVTPAPFATLLLAELDPGCLSGEEQVSGHKELPAMAQQFLMTPGMAAVAQTASYTIGSQRVYMAAAQGHPETAPPAGSDPTQTPSPTPFTVFTMAISTTWNNHLLVWLMSSNQIALLDKVSKSTVRFGRGTEAPLYPRAMGDANGAAASR